MYASRTTQFLVGVFALIGLAALSYLAFRLGKVEILVPPSYVIYANYDNVSGLKEGDAVEIAGVNVGKVLSIKLNQEQARVEMRINQGVKIDDDAIAAIRTRGIIGDKYVSISLGSTEKYLADGATLRQTESAFVLEDAIGQLINNMGSSGKKESKDCNCSEKGSNEIQDVPTITVPGAKPSARSHN